MNAFIVGASGFVGKYLANRLIKDGWSVCASKLPGENLNINGVNIYNLDLLDKLNTKAVFEKLRPDAVFHLAAQSSVALSWKRPDLTIDINVKGIVNLLDSIRDSGLNPRIMLIGSGEEYGKVLPEELPISENNYLRPRNIYAATKACQNMIGKIYSEAYKMDIVMIRAFNHIGPGQAKGFVVPDFCSQVANIEADRQEPVIRVGNLSAKRDFTDVQDIARAYSLLITEGMVGETYNVGSGKSVEIQKILDVILSLTKTSIKIEIDKNKFRPVEIPLIEADISKLKRVIDWKPEIPLEKTIEATLNYWRRQIK
jgi:GDP-4-dehydro-6-deoxy-D-mannose reductase